MCLRVNKKEMREDERQHQHMNANSKETDNNNNKVRNELSLLNNGGSLLNLNDRSLITERRYYVGANSSSRHKDEKENGCRTVVVRVVPYTVLYYGISHNNIRIIIAATKIVILIHFEHLWSFYHGVVDAFFFVEASCGCGGW